MSFNVVVLASGTGSLFESLIQHQGMYQIVSLITDTQSAGALEIATKYDIHAYICDLDDYQSRTEWNLAFLHLIERHHPDVVVSAGFMKILGPEIVDLLSGKLINIHPSLLPKFPGAHAVLDALNSGEKKTGTTVHYVDRGVDTGTIIRQIEVPIFDGDSEERLHERIKEVERTLIVEVVNEFAGGAK
jgi:phosphoribosylglycinamide formyltransferase-1